MPLRMLVLGGSSEASALARLLADRPDIEATLSLAGRTARPAPTPIALRSGGFGGVPGLIDYLASREVEAVVDATHPFAARMSLNAKEACARLRLPLVALTRAPWKPVDGDHWIEVADAAEAASALGEAPRRVFLTVGRLSLPAFAPGALSPLPHSRHRHAAGTRRPAASRSGPGAPALHVRGREAADAGREDRHRWSARTAAAKRPMRRSWRRAISACRS